jgi:NAD(P)-dependent dehydrogenase (short-subunit alcohol dehydrogenase family)
MTPEPITDFSGLVGIVTGGGTGMGRSLAVQLATSGSHVAVCDVSNDAMDETIRVARSAAPDTTRLTSYVADVADASAMDDFAAHVRREFDTETVHLLFNNAGIGGGGSLVVGDRDEWDRVFGVCWGGVLNGTRSFMPMLMAAERGHVVNTSSINGLWACLGPTGAHTAYSAAKFAVRGLTEALTVDFRVNAPHLTASVVMPGHIGTMIARNSMIEFGRNPKELRDDQIAEIRDLLMKRGIDVSVASDEDIRNVIAMRLEQFENDAPTTADDAATIILAGVRAGDWRILVGPDAHAIDEMLRARPLDAYTDEFMTELFAMGHFGGLIVD